MKNEHTNWETLSTPALEKLLSADFLSDEDNLSPEEIHEITEVIAKREREAHTLPQVDVDAAWETFLARIAAEENTALDHNGETETDIIPFQHPQEEKRIPNGKGRKKIRWNISIAAILCILVVVSVVPVSASGRLEDFVRWTTDTFFYPSSTGNDQILNSKEVYETLENTTDKFTALPILPKWFPDGTKVGTTSVDTNDAFTSISTDFSIGENDFYFSIRVINSADFGISEIEKNDGPVEEYVVNGISHFIMENYEQKIITWRNGNVQCTIYGYLSTNDLKKMVKSIYE